MLLLFLLFQVNILAQDWNSARLSLLYGGNIPFNFSSIKTYAEGIEIADGTILGVTLTDNNVVGHDLQGFDLNFRTFNGQAAITGSAGNLNLNAIRVKAENNLGLATGASEGYKDLSTGWVLLFSYTSIPFSDLAWNTHQLSLSYECGKPVSEGGNGILLGETPDYYTVEIEVELMPTGPGF